MKQQIAKSNTGIALLLLGIFLLFALGVTLVGSGIYRNIAASSEENFTETAALSYLANQIRQHDFPNGVSQGVLDGESAVVLHDHEATGEYLTYLYCYDGSLCELYLESGLELDPQNGTEILPLKALKFTEAEQGVWHLLVEDSQGRSSQLLVALRSTLRKGEVE